MSCAMHGLMMPTLGPLQKHAHAIAGYDHVNTSQPLPNEPALRAANAAGHGRHAKDSLPCAARIPDIGEAGPAAHFSEHSQTLCGTVEAQCTKFWGLQSVGS